MFCSNLVFLFCSHISSLLNVDTGYIFEQKCMSQVWKLVCISLFEGEMRRREREKHWVYLSEPSARASLGRYTVLPGAAGWQRWKTSCVLWARPPRLSLAAAAGPEIDRLEVCLVSFKSADSHKGFSHLGIIVALRVYILMVKGKKIIIIMKSYFEDGRPSNQSVFRQCVFKWTFIYKYLFVIASLKKKKKSFSVLYYYYLSFMYLYREKNTVLF